MDGIGGFEIILGLMLCCIMLGDNVPIAAYSDR